MPNGIFKEKMKSRPTRLAPRIRLSRDESRAETRRRLLDAAWQVFAEKGFEGCSVDNLVERAGYSKGAFYSNFESKDAIFLELLKEHKAEMLGRLEELLDADCSMNELLGRLEIYNRDLEKDTIWCLLSVEFQVRAAREPAFRKVFAEFSRIDQVKVARFIESLFERAGVQLPAKAESLAGAFMALIQGLALRRAADPRGLPAGATGELVSLLQRTLLGRNSLS
jgi:TetR/AcrR family transcriptional regulator, transcriptional repressor of aconitase